MSLHCYLPDLRARSVLAITVRFMQRNGFTHLFLDVDNTISPRDSCSVDQEIVDHIESLKKAGIEVWLVSNTWSSRRVGAIASVRLGVNFIVPGFRFDRWKPSSWCIEEVLRRAKTIKSNVVVAGDQLSDICAANRAGCACVLVDAIDPNDYHILTKWFKLPKQRRRLAQMAKENILPPFIEDCVVFTADLPEPPS